MARPARTPPSGTPIWRIESTRFITPGGVRGTSRCAAAGAVAPYASPSSTAPSAIEATLPAAAASSMASVASSTSWLTRTAP
jgi:hypothetical protein